MTLFFLFWGKPSIAAVYARGKGKLVRPAHTHPIIYFLESPDYFMKRFFFVFDDAFVFFFSIALDQW